jgi:UDP-glucuronate 4-epimerase
METILVTGAAGFVGARTCSLLLQRGYSVVGIDNMSSYYDVELKKYRVREIEIAATASALSRAGNKLKRALIGKFTFEVLNIEDINQLGNLFRKHKFKAVIHLAARAGVRASIEAPASYVATNTQGSANILECMRLSRVLKLVLASTSSLYRGKTVPFKETDPVEAIASPYAASKRAAEILAESYSHHYGIDVTILRYFSVYGPAGRPDMAPLRIINWIDRGHPVKINGSGLQRRDFTYIDDVAHATVLALKQVRFKVLNIGAGNRPTSILDFIKKAEAALGKRATIEFQPQNLADADLTWADNALATEVLGWRPMVSLDDGIQRTVDWFTTNIKVARRCLAK